MAGARSAARQVTWALTRSVATVTGLLVVYFTLPLRDHSGVGTVTLFTGGMVVVIGLVVWQLGAITRSEAPALRAIEAFASTVPFFLLLFAAFYVALDTASVHAFSEPVSRVDALYFTVTVFATVGFGDIAPVSEPARILVTIQMVGNLLVLGLVVRSMLEAVRRGQSRRQEAPDSPPTDSPRSGEDADAARS